MSCLRTSVPVSRALFVLSHYVQWSLFRLSNYVRRFVIPTVFCLLSWCAMCHTDGFCLLSWSTRCKADSSGLCPDKCLFYVADNQVESPQRYHRINRSLRYHYRDDKMSWIVCISLHQSWTLPSYTCPYMDMYMTVMFMIGVMIYRRFMTSCHPYSDIVVIYWYDDIVVGFQPDYLRHKTDIYQDKAQNYQPCTWSTKTVDKNHRYDTWHTMTADKKLSVWQIFVHSLTVWRAIIVHNVTVQRELLRPALMYEDSS